MPPPSDVFPATGLLSAAVEYPSGIELFHVGEPVRTLYFIEQGVIKLTSYGIAGRDVLVGLRESGWLLGAAETILSQSHWATATTMGHCTLRQVSSRDLLSAAIEQNLSAWIARMIAREAVENIRRISSLSGSGAERLSSFIEQWLRAVRTIALPDGGIRSAVPLTVEEIAQAVCLGREHVTRLLVALEAAGEIRRDRGWIVILRGSHLYTVDSSSAAKS